MRFADLYQFALGLPGPVVDVQKSLVPQIVAHHGDIGQVDFWSVELDPEVSFGHIVFERDRDSPYEDEFTVASIRLFERLNRCWGRFVGCKELMHVFDTFEERVTTREQFLRFLGELETRPMVGDMSPQLTSEHEAMWKALTVLCPKPRRDAFLDRWNAKTISAYDIALHFQVPTDCVTALMGPYYDDALAKVLAGP